MKQKKELIQLSKLYDIVADNPMDAVRSMNVGDIVIVAFNDFGKFRGFTTSLSYFNADKGRAKNVYVHSSSCRNELMYCLVATTAEENDAELADTNLKGSWKKRLPEEWLKVKGLKL